VKWIETIPVGAQRFNQEPYHSGDSLMWYSFFANGGHLDVTLDSISTDESRNNAALMQLHHYVDDLIVAVEIE
tara:strand:+ start:426 stop:644 length:219 start_codon:yes stop_codon:yes gene_type:complete